MGNLMTARLHPSTKVSRSSFTPVPRTMLQRKCACGGTPGPTGECADCRRKRLQHQAIHRAEPATVPPVVDEVLRSPGRPLEADVRASVEPHFGHDFDRVRVHTDARAAESARAVDALAYTVGRDIIFESGRYAPNTDEGRRLLAHELTHVVQQANIVAPNATQLLKPGQAASALYEAEADRNARYIDNDQPVITHTPNVGAALMRQASNSARSSALPTRDERINQARFGAWLRCHHAYEHLAGIGLPPPPRRSDPAEEWRLRARALARKIFNEDLNMDQVTEIVGRMRDRLSPGLSVVTAPTNDPECGTREGYVRDNRVPVYLCPSFFSASSEQQIRTMIHEAAHLAGIGEASAGESYCGIYDCETSCGGFNVADSWAHFVNCLSGQPADVPPTIQGVSP